MRVTLELSSACIGISRSVDGEFILWRVVWLIFLLIYIICPAVWLFASIGYICSPALTPPAKDYYCTECISCIWWVTSPLGLPPPDTIPEALYFECYRLLLSKYEEVDFNFRGPKRFFILLVELQCSWIFSLICLLLWIALNWSNSLSRFAKTSRCVYND